MGSIGECAEDAHIEADSRQVHHSGKQCYTKQRSFNSHINSPHTEIILPAISSTHVSYPTISSYQYEFGFHLSIQSFSTFLESSGDVPVPKLQTNLLAL
ncbi:hypothetical protein TNCT_505671 [Trichonephila clavata]|uniref:Uncharacterized protein n=1 Tax=Trichonephila clavata TaxID=2740835 RepID=A0A8X6L711_TRICU|nr:hypothetical protein TNCT_505671 [Trichonephila clavata]